VWRQWRFVYKCDWLKKSWSSLKVGNQSERFLFEELNCDERYYRSSYLPWWFEREIIRKTKETGHDFRKPLKLVKSPPAFWICDFWFWRGKHASFRRPAPPHPTPLRDFLKWFNFLSTVHLKRNQHRQSAIQIYLRNKNYVSHRLCRAFKKQCPI
jgi:hypothetical protein